MTWRAALLWCVVGFGVSLQVAQAQTPTGSTADSSATIIRPVLRDTAIAEPAVDTARRGFFAKALKNPYPNPERAALLSLALPGAGQVYNKRFWYLKVPVIYGGYAFLIANGEQNRRLRNDYQAAYRAELINPDSAHQFTGTRFDNLRALDIQRERTGKAYQLSYIGVVILHLVQTLEAYTTSHLLDFDMDESLTVRPALIPGGPDPKLGSTPGVAVSIRLGP